MKRIAIIAAAALFLPVSISAKVDLADVITDNMVLQQKSEVALWGWAEPKSTVRVSADWDASATVKAGKDGKWMVRLKTPSAGGPYTLKFNDGEETVVSNVLIGEVWLCSGQSNMEMTVRGYRNQPVEGSAELILGAGPSNRIRMCKIGRNAIDTPQERCKARWELSNPQSVGGVSVVAYMFAKYIQQILDVPVGLICTTWGGTPIEAWMERDMIMKYVPEYTDPKDGAPAHKMPASLYNGMVNPVVPFTVKGILWYQGEDNVRRYKQYERLMQGYAAMMREKFCNPELPFYFAQIAPYSYGHPQETTAALLMEAQYKASQSIPFSGMAVTVDVGEENVIHPAKKKEVAERLAFQALAKTYKVKGIEPDAPHFESVEFKDGAANVRLSESRQGLTPYRADIAGFELAGEDKVFHPATGRIYDMKNDKHCYVKVTSPEVAEPVAVRYCFRNWSVGTLFNAYGIPVAPFRSDDWK